LRASPSLHNEIEVNHHFSEKPYKVYSSDKNPVKDRNLQFRSELQGEYKEYQEAIDKAQTVLDSIQKGKYVYVEWQTMGNVIVVVTDIPKLPISIL
jgi:hypothetical protein